jgi:hypothetical protein
MLTPERFNILQRAFEEAKYSGLHDNIHPPPSLASELAGLITRKDIATSRHASQKIKTRFHGCFPPTLSPPYKNGPWSLKKKWHPPSTMTPRSANTGVNTQSRDKPFRANRNAFSSKFIGFSVCPIYHANTCF